MQPETMAEAYGARSPPKFLMERTLMLRHVSPNISKLPLYFAPFFVFGCHCLLASSLRLAKVGSSKYADLKACSQSMHALSMQQLVDCVRSLSNDSTPAIVGYCLYMLYTLQPI
jgi:hypothetical protein